MQKGSSSGLSSAECLLGHLLPATSTGISVSQKGTSFKKMGRICYAFIIIIIIIIIITLS
jgi:hypothetical protein